MKISKESFKEWALSLSPRVRIDFDNTQNCLGARYIKYLGLKFHAFGVESYFETPNALKSIAVPVWLAEIVSSLALTKVSTKKHLLEQIKSL